MTLALTIRRWLHLEDVDLLGPPVGLLLRMTGLSARARRNALDVRLERLDLFFSNLPGPFEGYRILFLSDLHINGFPELLPALLRALEQVEADLTVFAGDYHLRFRREWKQTVELMRPIVTAARAPDGVWGVRGNHDVEEVLAPLEELGLKLLHNGAVPFERDGQRLWLAGVDDPYYYRAADLGKALAGVPTGGFVILLAHTPELYRQAAQAGVSLYLCGHTHGGQVRIPGLGPLFLNMRAPRRLGSGLWREGEMIGYTSRGAGSTSVPLRFGCPPEITVVYLWRGKPAEIGNP
jgi:predicted MPP superfamily phosphohydrolase